MTVPDPPPVIPDPPPLVVPTRMPAPVEKKKSVYYYIDGHLIPVVEGSPAPAFVFPTTAPACPPWAPT